MTGFRDKELSDKLKKLGASIDEALTKKTDILIIKQEGDISEKVIKAQNYNITIITLEKFQEKYMK